MRTITIGPFPFMFSNRNEEMNLTPHAHHADVEVEYVTRGAIGYPSFKDTNLDVKIFIQSLKLKGFKGTNEDVVNHIFQSLDMWKPPSAEKYGNCNYILNSIKVRVYSYYDENHHDDGVTTYYQSIASRYDNG